jgi:hypothetical protein
MGEEIETTQQMGYFERNQYWNVFNQTSKIEIKSPSHAVSGAFIFGIWSSVKIFFLEQRGSK